MIPVISRRNKKSTVGKVGSKYYWLYDQFTTNRAAGAVNGTAAEPWGGTRTVTDTNSKITIGSGVLSFATGEAANDGVWYPAQVRLLGKTTIATLVHANTSGDVNFGWDVNASGLIQDAIRFFTTSTTLRVEDGGASKIVGVFTATTYQVAVVCRATGYWYYIKGGAFTNWTLLFVSATTSTASIFPSVVTRSTTSTFTADNMRVPKSLYIPVPLQSDGMSSATTDGLGNAENNGRTGNSYTNVGTWGVAAGKRSCSALSGSVGFSYLAATSADVIIDAVCTRSAGVTGIVARYADANNYLIAYHDGTNAKLDKVDAGVTTNLVSGAATYSATAVLRLILDGTTARLFYNNTAVGGVATTPSSTSLNHGLYTTDTGATFDNLVIWARGTGNEYSTLDSL